MPFCKRLKNDSDINASRFHSLVFLLAFCHEIALNQSHLQLIPSPRFFGRVAPIKIVFVTKRMFTNEYNDSVTIAVKSRTYYYRNPCRNLMQDHADTIAPR